MFPFVCAGCDKSIIGDVELLSMMMGLTKTNHGVAPYHFGCFAASRAHGCGQAEWPLPEALYLALYHLDPERAGYFYAQKESRGTSFPIGLPGS